MSHKPFLKRSGRVKTNRLDAPYSRIESDRLFDESGRLIPSSTVLGRGVSVDSEHVVRNCIVMPSKAINYSIKNQIIL